MADRFRVRHDGPATHVEFDDGRMNLLSKDALLELHALVADLSPHCRLLAFRSGRTSLFAAGADMREMRHFSAADAEEFSAEGQKLFDAIEKLACLTVVLIDGDCFGGALDLALAFDFRLATRRSRLAHPGAGLGIVTGFGGTSRWRKVMSRAAALQIFVANRVVSADEALQAGMIDECFEELDGRENELLESLLRVPVNRVRATKEVLRHADALSHSALQLLSRRLDQLYSVEGDLPLSSPIPLQT